MTYGFMHVSLSIDGHILIFLQNMLKMRGFILCSSLIVLYYY